MEWLERIYGDLYDISSRLRDVDDRYRLYRNLRTNKFEVYIGRALQFAVPFDELDARTIAYAKKTRIERKDELLAEIERHNRRLDEEKEKRTRDSMLASLNC